MKASVIALLLALCPAYSASTGAVHLELPQTGLAAREVAVVVNEDDPMSARVAEYYRERRGIPNENIIRVRFPAQNNNLARDQFTIIHEEVKRQTAPHVQAYALAWTKPYRVDCMSITSAFAFGFDEAYCSNQCASTKPSAYFNSPTHRPFADYQLRPTMMLAGRTLQDVKLLIEHGVTSDYTYPAGTGYLLDTSDKNRSVRAVFFEGTLKALREAFRLQQLEANSIKGKKDVLFYFTGLADVPHLPSLRFLPGAIADHLTSAGGQLTDSSQMSSLRWLEAGATGSYGTVVEPCNHLAKFPHPGVAMWRYAEGNTLIEAYWKSVVSPGEGVFIGEPLAKPFAPKLVETDDTHATLKVFAPEWKNLRLEAAASPIGPYRTADLYPLKPGLNEVRIRFPETAAFYRISL